MNWVGIVLYTLIGVSGFLYGLYSDRINFTMMEKLPGILSNRKVLFFGGLLVVLLGFGCAYAIGDHHAVITLIGGWIILLGSAPWFDRRIMRKSFAPPERRVIRNTMFAGLFITILSTGLLYFPPALSPGTFFIGLAITVLAGRLWWKQDVEFEYQHMVHSKRDYS